MKRSVKYVICFAVLILCLSICGTAFAADSDFEIDDEGVLTNYTGNSRSVTIPSTVTAIGSYAFSHNSNMTSVIIPDSVTKIGDDAFFDCYNLSKVVIPSSVTDMGSACFYKCYKLRTLGPAGGGYNIEIEWTDSIPDEAFRYSELVKVVIPDGITSIGVNAFARSYALQSVTLPASITEMETSVFYDCTNLRTVGPVGGGYDVEFGWTDEIPACSFESMPNLEKVVLPDTISIIGAESFYNCESLKDINMPSGLKEIGQYAFYGSGLERVCFPEGTEVIGHVAFCHCKQLKEIVFPESLTFISGGTFQGCTSLKTVSLPENLETVGYGAFSDCTALSEVIIYCPKKVINQNGPFYRDSETGTVYVPKEWGETSWLEGWNVVQIEAPVTTSAKNYGAGILVEWDKVPGATGYVVYRRAMTGSETKWTTFARWNNTAALSFFDTKVYEGTKYQYGIKAYYGDDPTTTTSLGPVGPMSKAVVYAKKPETTATTYVENVRSGISVSWDEVKGATGYVIYRRAWSSTTGGWTDFQRWNNTTGTSWIDTKVYAGTRYQYGVKAYYGGSPKDMAYVGSVGPLKTTVRITTRTAWFEKGANNGEVKILWDGSSVFTGYQLQYSGTEEFTKATTFKITDKSVTSKILNVGYCYIRVRSYTVFNGMTYFGQWSKPIEVSV